MLHDLDGQIVFQLLLAGVLGGIVGIERELGHKPAGIRTNMLIALGSALFTVISYRLAGNVGGDHTRVAAQIIPGIGFIGAGVVIRERGTIIGITSAATLFVVASVGMAVGSNMYVTAIFTTLLLLASLVAIGQIEDRFGLHSRMVNFFITAAPPDDPIPAVRQTLHEVGVRARGWNTDSTATTVMIEFDADVTLAQERELASRFQKLKIHCQTRAIAPVVAL
jgi:putative Mg2+ transporter-C (MgtC) family protein